MKERERFILELEDMPGYDRPAIVRLRAFLKIIGRAFGLKLLRGERVAQEATRTDSDALPTPRGAD